MKILIVEDNSILRDNLVFLLKKFNYLGETAVNGEEGILKIFKQNYDAIILDINMPVMNGKDFLKHIRSQGKTIPVIALTSDSMLEDKLGMFDLGVDDYITKPFEIEELVARLKSILNRGDKKIDKKLTIGNIEINYDSNNVRIDGENIDIPRKQYLIVEFLSRNKGYPISKTKIMEYVWGEAEENLDFNSTTLESHIYVIRKKLGKNFIKTVKGVGYVID